MHGVARQCSHSTCITFPCCCAGPCSDAADTVRPTGSKWLTCSASFPLALLAAGCCCPAALHSCGPTEAQHPCCQAPAAAAGCSLTVRLQQAEAHQASAPAEVRHMLKHHSVARPSAQGRYCCMLNWSFDGRGLLYSLCCLANIDWLTPVPVPTVVQLCNTQLCAARAGTSTARLRQRLWWCAATAAQPCNGRMAPWLPAWTLRLMTVLAATGCWPCTAAWWALLPALMPAAALCSTPAGR